MHTAQTVFLLGSLVCKALWVMLYNTMEHPYNLVREVPNM